MPSLFKFINGNAAIDTLIDFLLAAFEGVLLWWTGKLFFKILAIFSFILSFWMLFSLM